MAGRQTICLSNTDTISEYLTDGKNGNVNFKVEGDLFNFNGSTSTYTTSSGKKLVCTIPMTTIDSYGIDLAKLPEGQTVKVFENGPTEEVSYGNKTTVTYVRTEDNIAITSVIVYDGDRGSTKYIQTVSLK
jgi:hypothetical protein